MRAHLPILEGLLSDRVLQEGVQTTQRLVQFAGVQVDSLDVETEPREKVLRCQVRPWVVIL